MSTIAAVTSPAVTVRRPARRMPHARPALALKVRHARMALAVPRVPAAPAAPVAPVAVARAASIRAAVAVRRRQAKDTGGVLMV